MINNKGLLTHVYSILSFRILVPEFKLNINWRASVASETLTGVTQLKIGDVCLFIYLLASERSERDSIRGG